MLLFALMLRGPVRLVSSPPYGWPPPVCDMAGPAADLPVGPAICFFSWALNPELGSISPRVASSIMISIAPRLRYLTLRVGD